MALSGGRNRRLAWIIIVALMLGAVASGGVRWSRRPEASLYQKAVEAYQRGDWAAAEKNARDHLKHKRNDAAASRLLARALYRQGRDVLASDVHTIVKDDQLEAEDLFLVGKALARKGQNDRAIYVWRKALEVDPNHAETMAAFVRTLTRQDLLNEAAEVAAKLAVQPHWEAQGALLLAGIRARQGDASAAAQAYRHALDRPDQWHRLDDLDQVRKELARMLLCVEQPAEARGELLNLAASAHDPEAGWLLSRCDLQQGKKTDRGVLDLARSYRQSHLLEPDPAPYAGESQCTACHASIYRSQHASRHARTFVHTDQLAALALPARPVSDPSNPRISHQFEKRQGQVDVLTRVADHVLKTVFDYALGSGDRGLTLVGHDAKNLFYESRLSLYPEGVGWDVTSGHPNHPDMPASLYQGMTLGLDAVRRCLACHATSALGIMKGLEPEGSDKGIGCERCHGPGGNHIKAVALKDPSADLAIARPALTYGPAIVGLCAGCHSPRNQGTHLSPGAEDSIRFQGTTLTWSRCYTESGNRLDCVTCHDPHRDVETRKEWYASRCLGCHSSPDRSSGHRPEAGPRRPVFAAQTVCPVNPATNCIDCHMPRRKTSMAHTSFTDHFIRSPRAE
jgi:tetratricopeptide (TPR) repeat protein